MGTNTCHKQELLLKLLHISLCFIQVRLCEASKSKPEHKDE